MHFFRKRQIWEDDLIDSPNLVVSNQRLKREGRLLRRLAPALYTRFCSISTGRRRDTARREFMDKFFSQSKALLFTNLQLETQNRCNGECSFCPVNRKVDERPYARMSEELYDSLLRQLATLNYNKTFGFFSNNEPLLDKRLPLFLREAKSRLPRARLTVVTNGTLLNVELFRKLMSSLKGIVINDYNEECGLHDNIREIRNYCLSPEGRELIKGKKVTIEMRNPKVILGSRGGSSRNRKPVSRSLNTLCLCMFRQFIVRPDGRISLCCNDALGAVTLGDLNRQSIEEIWNGQAFGESRRLMADSGRKGLALCSACDFSGL